MADPAQDGIKRRRIALTGAGDQDTLLRAVRALAGVREAQFSGSELRVSYMLARVCLRDLEQLAEQCAYALSADPVATLRRSLIHYCESNERDAHDYESGWDVYVRNAYMSRYRNRRHGRIDDRPQQWRRYLERESLNDDRV